MALEIRREVTFWEESGAVPGRMPEVEKNLLTSPRLKQLAHYISWPKGWLNYLKL